jgi:hypothetical protein
MVLRRVRARSAIVVIAADDLGRIFTLHTWADRCPTEQLVARIFEINAQWAPRRFGCEANAMQALFADLVLAKAREASVTLPLVPVSQPTNVEKDWRIRTTLQPLYADGRLFLQPHQHELRAEVVSFPMSTTKDLIDALASAVKLLPPTPTRKAHDGERAALAQFLRESGVEPDRLTARLREFDAERGIIGG